MAFKTEKTELSSDPAQVFQGLVGRYDHCFLLETLGGDTGGGKAYIGVAPRHVYESRGGRFYADGKPAQGDPYAALRRNLPVAQANTNGFGGGLVGYMSHEAIATAEPVLAFRYEREFPDFQFGAYEDGLLYEGGSPVYFYTGENRRPLYEPAIAPSPALSIDYVGVAKDRQAYLEMVRKARHDIRDGRVFQAVLANKYEYHYSGELFALYLELRRINPSPFMFFIKFGDRITMGASPELLLKTAGGKAYLEALAGTIKRGTTPAEDAELARRLQHDEKEIAEHNMLVDLYRNDLGRVAEVGSVHIDDLKYVKKLSHVQHLCSLISGRLAADKDMFDALSAVFPAGTLVGAPKIEAAKMIAELEGYERGPFGGSVGYFGYGGESMHAVNIRAVNATGNKLFLHTGSGIVYDSRPDREYREISAKKAAMDAAMAKFLRSKA